MSEFLTPDEQSIYFDIILNKPGYIKSHKDSFTTVRIDQILEYARDVLFHASTQLEYNISADSPVRNWEKGNKIYKFPSFPANDPEKIEYRMRLLYWIGASNKVIKIIKEYKKQGRKKTEIKPTLKLSDVLIEGESAAEIKNYYDTRKHTNIYLGKFLRILALKGYFNTKLYSKDYQAIGRNDFYSTYNDRNEYKAPALKDLYKYPKFRDIPLPKRARTL
jgi:hypothetical protein